MTDKTNSWLAFFFLLIRVGLYGVMLRFVYRETGVWTVVSLALGMVMVEVVDYSIGLYRKMIGQSNERFAAILPVIEGIVNEITELKKARISASMTITSAGLGPIDPNTPLAEKQEGM